MPISIPILSGPTASGKTALSLELASQFPLEIISADAMMVYRGMDIGTAKPTKAQQALIPHHLIDIASPEEPYDVAQFSQDTEKTLEDILKRKKIPLVVGGTGFYLSALLKGLPTTPPAQPKIQQQLQQELQERGLEALLAEIAHIQPSELERLERNPRRVIRALELYRTTGRFPSQFPLKPPQFPAQAFAIQPDWTHLEQNIQQRVDEMLTNGLIAEVQGLRTRWSSKQGRLPTALQAIGYKETLEYLDHDHTLDWLRETLILRTRQYAKRQITWIRTQLAIPLRPPEEVRRSLIDLFESWHS